MKASQAALEHIRKSINTADALRMKSSAVLVADLKVLLNMAESAIQDQSVVLEGRPANEPVTRE
jgi:hypothetical protein